MVDIDKLLMGEDPAPRKRDRVDDILDGITPVQTSVGGKEGIYMLQTGQESTGAVDTRTSKPVMRPVPTGEQEATFDSLAKSRRVDDPQTRINILAKNRGISPDRYGFVSGRIVYQGDDGNLYFEEPDPKTLGGLAKDTAASAVGHREEVVLGTAGAAGGPLTAGILAAGGAGWRKVRGKLEYDEPQTELGNIKEMGVAGITAGVGTYLGGKLIHGIDRTKGKQAATMMKLAGTERLHMNPQQIADMDALARKFGIELWVPETTGSHELIARFKFLGDIPVTADKIGQARMKRYGELNKAINNWLDEFAPPTTTPGEAGRRTVEAAEGAMGAPYKAAQAASKDLYEQAKQVRGVDVSETVAKIDSLLSETPSGGVEQGALQKIRGMLVKKEKGPDGKIIEVAEDRVSVLDKVKKEINTMWKADPQTAPDKDAQRAINQTLDDMLTSIDNQVPVYKQARAAYAEKMQAYGVDELKKSKVAALSKLQGDKVEGAARAVLSPSQSSPEIVDMTKKAIIDNGGQEAWDALLRVHLKSKLRDVVKSNTQNVGGMLHKKLVMDLDQYDILRRAMSPEQFQTFNDFMQVLQKTGLTTGKESATGGRQVSQEQMKREASGMTGKALRAISYPMVSWKMMVAQFREELKTEAFQIGLADAMLDPQNTTRFRSMLQLQPKSQKLIKQFSTFLTSVSGGELEEILGQSTRQDVLPATLQQRLATPQKLRGGRLEWLQ